MTIQANWVNSERSSTALSDPRINQEPLITL
ncbi:hypothetical protein LINPERHAP1_LOCUS36036 [Linum perenne]